MAAGEEVFDMLYYGSKELSNEVRHNLDETNRAIEDVLSSETPEKVRMRLLPAAIRVVATAKGSARGFDLMMNNVLLAGQNGTTLYVEGAACLSFCVI